MNFIMKSTKPYKGFLLQNEVSFEGYSCLLTGKNGSGKTRLLNGIISSCIDIYLNGEKLETTDIKEISTIGFNLNKFTSTGSSEINKKLAEKILIFISEKKELIDTYPIHLDNNYNSEPYTANTLEITKNASLLFNKEFNKLSLEELQLSIILNKELNNNVRGPFSESKFDSLSQASIDYQLAFRINRAIRFNRSEGDDVTELPEEIILKYMGKKSPYEIFNDIVNKMFRGKFSVSPPDEKTGFINYTPKLVLSTTGEIVNTTDLSDGEKTIFWLVIKTFEIAIASPDEHLKKSKLILLDEPDSRLHPLMIIDFLDCLKLLHKHLNIGFIFTTHSPTTVALMDSENIFNIDVDLESNKHSLIKQSKDLAISQLLDGVVQVSVNPENSRQIYVENSNDQSIYELIYRNIKNRSQKIAKELPLSFISAGPKIDEKELLKHIKKVYGESDKNTALITAINGDGDCAEVIGMVTHLVKMGNRTIRGIIDWDNQDRKAIKEIIVFAKNYSYSIENTVYDPLSLYAFNIYESFHTPDHYFPCEDGFEWRNALDDPGKIQSIVDTVTKDILGRDNKRDHSIKYLGGKEVFGDKEYFLPSGKDTGHSLEEKITNKYHSIKSLIPSSRQTGKPIMYFFMKRSTIGLLGWEYINTAFEDLFESCSTN